MKNRLINTSQKTTLLLVALVVMLSFLLTGCNVELLLQDLATDYIQVNVDYELQSESYRNEQLYTYQIDAVITNNYIFDLSDATITLTVPSGVEIVEGKSKIKEKFRVARRTNIPTLGWCLLNLLARIET